MIAYDVLLSPEPIHTLSEYFSNEFILKLHFNLAHFEIRFNWQGFE